jgi:hypothetical protein
VTPRADYQLEMRLAPDEIIVDSFAGGGGASLGIQWALGRGPHIAINHDKEAIALHAANHPDSEHYPEDVWHVDPVVACAGRKVGLMWLSPDCKHFSKAKGGKPVSKKIRGLAWTAVRWATAVRPRVIVLENVEEFQTWGPVDRDDESRPAPSAKGPHVQALRRTPSAARLPGRVARAPRVRLRRADDSQAAIPDRALRRSADHLADADARQGTRTAVAHRGGVHRLVDRVPVDLRAQEGARRQHAPADRARDQAVRHRLADAVHRPVLHAKRLGDDRVSTD